MQAYLAACLCLVLGSAAMAEAQSSMMVSFTKQHDLSNVLYRSASTVTKAAMLDIDTLMV